MSPFAIAAARRIALLPKDSPERIILRFLLKHGQGRMHAQPWVMLEQELRDHGIAMAKDRFQQTILADSRDKTGVFIAASDRHPLPGYYIIDNERDAEEMLGWYRGRENSFKRRRRILQSLMREAWPEHRKATPTN